MLYQETEDMKILWDNEKMKAIMAQYNTDGSDLTNNHPFVTQYLLPLLQRVSDTITGISDPNDPQHTTVSIEIIDANSVHESWHDHKTYETFLRYDITLPIQSLANSLWHETEHAQQTLGRGYSIDEQTMVRLARFCYTNAGPEYLNNFVELRARLEAARVQMDKMHQMNADPNVTLEQKEAFRSECCSNTGHLIDKVDEAVAVDWIADCQKRINNIPNWSLWQTKSQSELMEVFPEAKDIKEAKEMALHFLANRAEGILRQCVADVKRMHESLTKLEGQVTQERAQHNIQCAEQHALDLAKQKSIPLLTTVPEPRPHAWNKIEDEHKVDLLFADKNGLYNKALIRVDNNLYLIADPFDSIYRDYAHPRPPELTPKPEEPQPASETVVDLNECLVSQEEKPEEIFDLDDDERFDD